MLTPALLGLAAFCGAEAVAQSPAATTTSIAVTSSGTAVTSVSAGTVVTLTAAVQSGANSVTKGQVNFCDASASYCTDIHLLGTAQLTSAGTATLKLRPGIGSHSYKAVFPGTNIYSGSVSGASALTATGTIPSLATAATINQTGSWGAYTLSATVTETGNIAPPTGLVSFLDTNYGNAVLGTGTLGSATRGVNWTTVDSSAPSVAAVFFAVADLNGDGIPDLFVKDYFGTYDVLLGKGDGTFTVLGSPFGPTSETGSFIVGDFNNDGIPDVAAINAAEYASSGTITIFLGNGDGTFTVLGSSPAIGMNPSGIAAADINGDGNVDLAVSQTDSSGNGQIVVFFGNGDGTFTQASSTTSVTSTASSIIPADVNGDGKIDLVLSGIGQSGITILLGNGDGTFTELAGPSQAGEATASVADVNNDGIPDLVFPAANTSYLTVFLGNGDGTFTEAPSSPNVNLQIGSAVIGDLNQDGIPDVVYTNGDGAGVLFGKGDGSFVQAPATIAYPYDFSGNLVVADFNGDGWPDVLTIDGNTRTVEDALTQPTETATASANVSIPVAGAHLADASYPGDSNYNSSTSGTVSLWGAPPATTTALTVTSGGSAVSSVTTGTAVTLTATVTAGANPVTAGQVDFCDASATSCSDIHLLGTVALSSNGTAAFNFVPGPGSHSYKAVFVEDGYGLTSSSAAASLTVGPAPAVSYSDTIAISNGGTTGDYSLTATVVGYGGSAPPTGNVSFLDTSFGNAQLAAATLGSSTAGVGWLISQTQAAGGDLVAEAVGDFNQDGIPDVAVLWTNSSTGGLSVTIFTGKGDGTFTAGTSISTGISDATGPYMITGDFNGDGKTDLAILTMGSTSFTNSVTILLSNGDGTFAAPQTSAAFNQPNSGGDVYFGSMTAADFNGDGKLDLAIVGDCVASCGVTILLGNGDGTFGAGTTLASTQAFGQIATGDFNGDGIPDLIATNYFEDNSSPTIFLGKGDGTFTAAAASFTLDYFPTSIVVGDFNGDGVLDLAFSDLSGVEIALGNGDGTFNETAASPISVPSELYSVIAGDFNQDGKVDLAGVDNYNDRIVLLIGAGDGTFTVTPTTPVVSQDFLGPFAIAAADFNEDGAPDLAMLTKNTVTASILINEPTETATASVTGIAPLGAGTHNVEASYAGDSNYGSGVSGTVALTAGLAPLVISPTSGTYSSAQTLTISESIPGATIYYEAIGPVSTNGFVQYTGPITLNAQGTEMIEAYATETGYQSSNYASATYSLNIAIAATPVITPAGGSYTSPQSVTITDATTGATIYYTTDGTNPTTSSTVYAGPITVASSETINAVAVATGFTESAVASAVYTINAPTPTLGNLSPAFVAAGGAAFSLTINGSGFMPNSTAYWGTTALTTQYVSASQLKAQITAAQIANAGVNAVTVQTPAPGGGTSNTMQFEVDTAGSTTPPSFTTVTASVSPGSTASYPVTLPSSASNVTVNCLNLPTGATCSYSANSSTLTIATSPTTPAGTYQITVVFTETLPGSASALIFVPFLLLPLVVFRKRWTTQQVWLLAVLAFALAAVAVSGCGGGSSGGTTPPQNPTYQVTSSGTVTLTVQ